MNLRLPIIASGLALSIGLGGMARSSAETALNVDQVIQKAVKRGQQDQLGSVPDFKYRKLTASEELDSAGNVKERREKIYEISYRDGLSHATLLAVNGHPPTGQDLKQQSDNEMSLNKLLGQTKSAKGDNRESFLTADLVSRFNFKILSQTTLNGRATYEISFEPKSPTPPAHRLVDRLLGQISGTLWIDAQEFEVARADVSLRSEVNLFGGIIGSLKKLTYTLERTRIANGIWFSTLSSGDFQGRKLLDPTHIKTSSKSVNFRRAA
jgi:hypothetical protein